MLQLAAQGAHRAHRAHDAHEPLRAQGARALGRWEAEGAGPLGRRMQAPRVNTASCCAARTLCDRQLARTLATGRTVRDPTALRATSLTPTTPNTFDYLRVSQSAQNIMCGDTFLRTVRQGDTGGSAKRQSRLGRDTSVRGALCAHAAPPPRTAAAASRDAATPKPSKRYGGQRPPSR